VFRSVSGNFGLDVRNGLMAPESESSNSWTASALRFAPESF
jgi:hypothetical protein